MSESKPSVHWYIFFQKKLLIFFIGKKKKIRTQTHPWKRKFILVHKKLRFRENKFLTVKFFINTKIKLALYVNFCNFLTNDIRSNSKSQNKKFKNLIFQVYTSRLGTIRSWPTSFLDYLKYFNVLRGSIIFTSNKMKNCLQRKKTIKAYE